jgi:hypothetical protein
MRNRHLPRLPEPGGVVQRAERQLCTQRDRDPVVDAQTPSLGAHVTEVALLQRRDVCSNIKLQPGVATPFIGRGNRDTGSSEHISIASIVGFKDKTNFTRNRSNHEQAKLAPLPVRHIRAAHPHPRTNDETAQHPSRMPVMALVVQSRTQASRAAMASPRSR